MQGEQTLGILNVMGSTPAKGGCRDQAFVSVFIDLSQSPNKVRHAEVCRVGKNQGEFPVSLVSTISWN